MIRSMSIFQAGAAVVLVAGACASALAQAPTAAPPVPSLSPEQRNAAAAIQPPATVAPPLPGQLQGSAPAPGAPQPAVPTATTGSSASKMQALEAVTQQPTVQEVPRVAAPSDKVAITSSTSTSGQFIVHGKVFETRSAMSSRCEEISQELRKVLNDKEGWVLPVVVLLNVGEEAMKSKGPPISTAITEMSHGGFHVQVTVNERAGLNATDLRKEVVRALLAERILRNHPKLSTPEGRLLLPDWIMTGVVQAMDYKATARPSAIFATIFRSGKIYGIEEIIAASPVQMDGLSRTIYETSCCALVLALVDQPEGPQRFNKFLNSLATDPRSERELLDAAFPNFAASSSSLNKWWSLQLAALSRPGVAEPYTPEASLKAVEDAIMIRYAAQPAEVPQNVTPRPFVLPPSLFTPPPPTPEPKPEAQPLAQESSGARSSPAPSSRPKQTAESQAPAPADQPPETAAAPEADEKPQRALWRRMLFLNGPKNSEEKPAETTLPEPAEESKPGFLGRMFGGGSSTSKPEATTVPAPATITPAPAPAVAVPAPKAAAAAETPRPTVPPEKPKTPAPAAKTKVEQTPPAPAAAPAPQPEEKPSKLNPLNWFRGGKKSAESEAPAKDSQASSEVNFARLLSPALADAWEALAPTGPRQTVDPLFFLRRKSKAEEPAPVVEAPKPEPKKQTPKKAPSKSGKPRTSNPNSKSTAKPSTATPGKPETNNPNSRPVPAAIVPAGAAGAGAPAGAGNGLVPVILPLEEYKLIMKRPDRGEILDRNIATLRALDLRVSVLFRPVILGYLSAVTDLKDGKTKDMDKRLATLRQFALVAYQKSVAVRDFLDYVEVTERGGLSGKFEDYLDLPAIIQKELPAREDPISKYLEAIDNEFSK